MYELIIIGLGPCGLTASLYASCFKLKHAIIGKILGGQMSLAPDIINYPGFEQITGKELTDKMVSQIKNKGAEILETSVLKVEKKENGFLVFTEDGKTLETKSLILATGTERRKLNIKGETEYTGKGINYSITSDQSIYQNKIVAVIGGANSAVCSAIQLATVATKTYIIYRGQELRCDPIRLEQIKQNPKIEVLYNTQIAEAIGDGQKLTGVKIKVTEQGQEVIKDLPLEEVFIEIGGVPGTSLLIPLGIDLDENGFIKANEELSTNIPGIFAAGDVISSKTSIEQISSAVGLGARAATSAFTFLKGQKAPTLWGESQIKRAL